MILTAKRLGCQQIVTTEERDMIDSLRQAFVFVIISNKVYVENFLDTEKFSFAMLAFNIFPGNSSKHTIQGVFCKNGEGFFVFVLFMRNMAISNQKMIVKVTTKAQNET